MAAVTERSIISFPIERVWEKIRDFNAIPSAHPAVAGSRIEDGLPSDQVGCVRNFTLKQGGVFRERLIALDDKRRVCSYAILESPLPLENYTATIQLGRAENPDFTDVVWRAQFDCSEAREAELQSWVGDVLRDGFGCLQSMLAPHAKK